jgi:DNA-binding MarR family transcriptional regulator
MRSGLESPPGLRRLEAAREQLQRYYDNLRSIAHEAGFRMTGHQVLILVWFRLEPRLRLDQLRENATYNIGVLVDRGLATSRIDPFDRRARMVELTTAGLQLADQAIRSLA